MSSTEWWAPALWVLNGFLAALYMLLAIWPTWVVLVSLLPLTLRQDDPLTRRWMIGVAALMVVAATFSPPTVGLLMATMAAAGYAAWRMERFNPRALYWRVLQGLALYALIALGVLAYHHVLARADANWLAAGQSYLEALAGVAIFGYPLGYLAMLAQAVFAHPPLPQGPEEFIHTVRTRGQKGL